MNDSMPRGAEDAFNRAEIYKKNPAKALDLVEEASRNAAKLGGDFLTLLRLVKAWATGKYVEVPWRTIALAVGAVTYFVVPLDLIPDWIPVAGYLDDAMVVGWVMRSIREDVLGFQDWEARRGR